ncbi:MAG: hypothetical protein WAN11_25980 [Syntrophobacteraceae bacterium]
MRCKNRVVGVSARIDLGHRVHVDEIIHALIAGAEGPDRNALVKRLVRIGHDSLFHQLR